MSWFRDWLNRASPKPDGKAEASDPDPADHAAGFHIRDAERRQLRRLLRRRDDLSYDLQLAQQALQSDNQWTERIEQLDAAIEQARADRQAIEPQPDGRTRPQLSSTPVEIVALQEADPAEVTLVAGSTRITYREELDWAERGHQVTLPELNRIDGDVEGLLPELADDKVRQELREHLRHSLATLANQVLEDQASGNDLPALTLADLTAPCPGCGGWLDQKGRCPVCAELDWRRQEIDSDLRRLRKERDDVLQDLERYRDRLPIIQRQVAETDADIEKLRAKGVEPA